MEAAVAYRLSAKGGVIRLFLNKKQRIFVKKTSIQERIAQPLTKALIAARFQNELQNERASTAEEKGSPHVAQNHATKTLVSR